MYNMNKNKVVEIKNLTKTFRSWESLPDRQFKSFLISLLRFNFGNSKYQRVPVLDNVSFDVHEGDFLGIMGRNGIGKSTILKLISGIYVPSGGAIETHGRIIPLLELGAGFDAEMTGFENIYLNAAILGYAPSFIDENIESIIKFSELGSKINLLVKNYSSGMLVRLGFSIAVHMNFDILLLDEVLGVGDAGFIEKSTSKIRELNKAGKTVILVTHNMQEVAEYCNRCIVVNDKKIIYDGDVTQGIKVYGDSVRST